MTARIEQKEIEASLDAGRADQWGTDEYVLDGDYLCRVDPRSPRLRWYAPLEHPELPGEFAAIATAADPGAATLAFCRAYGRLGFEEWGDLLDPFRTWRREYWPGWIDRYPVGPRRFAEPLAWITAHAGTVRWCLLAIRHSQTRRGDPGRVWRLRPEHWALGLRVTTEGSAGNWWLGRQWRGTERDIQIVVSEALRANTHVERRVVYDDDRRVFRNLWRGAALLDSIYQLVADAAVGGRVTTCEACGAAFIQTDGRQRFCPPNVNEDASPCGVRSRVTRWRERAALKARARRRTPTVHTKGGRRR
jgi:hypothetical protein